MIGYIKGRITDAGENTVIIENNGIGFRVNVADITAFPSPDSGVETVIYTAMMVREDDISLCGFPSKGDLKLFSRLLTVSGVGTKAALALLGTLSADALSRAIVFEDVESITRAPGIGKKSAQRIVLELKDKLGDISGLSGQETSFASEDIAAASDGEPKTEALQALMALGYSKSEAASALGKITEEFDSSQDYIRLALSKL